MIGALMGVTDLNKPNFLDKITDNHYGKTGDYRLVAPQHKVIITGTDKSLILQPTPAPGINPMMDQYAQGFEGSGVLVDTRGIKVLASAKQIPLAGWFLAVRMPIAEAFAPIDHMLQRILLITFFMTLLAGGLTWWMLRRQLAPMLAAVKILDTRSDTNLPSQPLPVTRQDEVGELIGGFNRLLGTLGQREEALRENQKRLADIIEFLPDPTLAIDKEGRVIIWNKAIVKMTGIPASEMIGKGAHTCAIPFYGEARPQLMDLILEDNKELAAQYPLIIREGDTLITEVFCNALYSNKGAWIYAKASPLYSQAGNIIGVIESMRDVTERKQAEETLRESDEKFRTVADHIHDWEYWMAGDGSLVYVSPSCERITGYKAEEFHQDPGLISRIIHPDDHENFMQHIKDVAQGMANRECHTRNFRILTQNGEERWIAHVCQEVFSREGKSMGRRVSNRDITERKQAEEEKLKLEGQLQQAQKMEAIGQLAGGVAHDFNNMLGVIIGQAELALDDVAPGQPLFNNLKEIRKAATRSADITRQLLALAR